jgi:hypothetical protein
LFAIIKAIACIKIDKQPCLVVFDQNPKTGQAGFFVYLNTGNGFDSGKQWQSNLGGPGNWKNSPTHENGLCHCLPLSKPLPVLR